MTDTPSPEPTLPEQLQDTTEQLALYESDLSDPNSGLDADGRAQLEEKVRRLRRLRHRIETQLGAGPAGPVTAPPPPAGPAGPAGPAAPPAPPPGPAPPPLQAPQVHIETDGGVGIPTLYADRPFHVVVLAPRAGTPAPTVTVHFQAPSGGHTLTLAWDGGISGPVRYRSEPVTLEGGAEGGGRLQFELPVHAPGRVAIGEIAVGGMSGWSVGNGDVVTVSVTTPAGEATTSLPAYRTARDHAIEANRDFFAGMHQLVVEGLLKLRPLGDLPAAVSARRILTQKLDLLEHARITMNDPRNEGPIAQLAWGNEYVGLVRQPGLVDPMTEREATLRAARDIHERYEHVMDTFVKDFGVGFYQFVVGQIPLAGSLWTVLYGTDILGNKVEGWERVTAALDAAGQAAMLGLPAAIDQAHAVATTTARLGADSAPVVAQGPALNVLRAPAGTPVREVEAFGIDRNQVAIVRRTLDAHAELLARIEGVPYRKIYVGVRATSEEALGRAAEGHPGKPEPIKSKTTDQYDIAGGWGKDDGVALYVTPEQVAGPLGLTPEQIVRPVADPTADGGRGWAVQGRPANVSQPVWDRAVQRIQAFHDEAPMMDELVQRGLVRLDGDGRVIDTGVSNYRLDPQTHELTKVFDGPATGTGKAIYGDPDLYAFWFEDGSMLTTEQIAPIVTELGPRYVVTPDGVVVTGARVMHPDIASWDPHEPKNVGIMRKIMGKHQGAAQLDEQGVAVGFGPSGPNSEGLLIVGGFTDPSTVGWGGALVVGAKELTPAAPRRWAPVRTRRGRLVTLGVGVVAAAGIAAGAVAVSGGTPHRPASGTPATHSARSGGAGAGTQPPSPSSVPSSAPSSVPTSGAAGGPAVPTVSVLPDRSCNNLSQCTTYDLSILNTGAQPIDGVTVNLIPAAPISAFVLTGQPAAMPTGVEDAWEIAPATIAPGTTVTGTFTVTGPVGTQDVVSVYTTDDGFVDSIGQSLHVGKRP